VWDVTTRQALLSTRPPVGSERLADPDVPLGELSGYVEQLIGPDVVNTMPEATLRAFADYGRVARTLDADPGEAERTLDAARAADVDLERITAELTREGVQAFCASYRQLLDRIQSKLPRLGHETLTIETPRPLTAATHPPRWDP
jgi:transaldolase